MIIKFLTSLIITVMINKTKVDLLYGLSIFYVELVIQCTLLKEALATILTQKIICFGNW
jgi:hypothetical protein